MQYLLKQLNPIQNICKDIFEFFFPEFCVSCNCKTLLQERYICTICLSSLPTTDNYFITQKKLQQKFCGKVLIRNVDALLVFEKDNTVQKIIHELKYKNLSKIAYLLGLHYAYEFKKKYNFQQNIDGIIPVPLHSSKLKQRGYNQSLLFAQGISEGINIPCLDDVLQKHLYTETQTKKNKIERWLNVANCFSLTHSSKVQVIKNKNILLVDDVLTTGSTLEACAHVLLSRGASNIDILVMSVVA